MGSAFRKSLLLQCGLSCVFWSSVLTWGQANQPNSAQPPITQAPRIIQAIDESVVTRLKGNTHPLASPQFDRGAAPANLPMDRMLLVLRRSPEQESALTKLLDEQQDKSSPNYHKWLTPEEFGQKFGPAYQDIQGVTSWLQSHGFQVTKVAKGRTVIEFSGTAGQVQEAFHTAIHKYAVKGEEHWANATDPQIPTALAPVVAGVHTLHNFHKKPQLVTTGQKITAKYIPGPPPQVTIPPQNGQPAVHGLGWADYATIYNINPVYSSGINGAGAAIAVVARSDILSAGQDINDFRNIFGVPCCLNLRILIDGPDPGELRGSEELEATLDVTWASAVAPGALIDFVVSASTDTTDGVDLSELYIVDNNLANVMTESFGSCEQDLQASGTSLIHIGNLAEQAAAEGITYVVAAGDSGSAGCDNPNTETVAVGPLAVNGLAATPFNVAVGGTVFNENENEGIYWNATNAQGSFESAKSYIPEDVWNDSCSAVHCGANNANIFASGGGVSTFFAKPSWQSGVPGIPADGFRDLPDISLTASIHDFYIVCFLGSCSPNPQGLFSFVGVGGTSASTPAFAGLMALVNQKMSQANPADSRQGQANYVLYKLAGSESSSLAQCNASNTTALPATNCIFNDVTVGANVVPGESGQTYSAGKGYDLATGLGSVNAANLVNNWDKSMPTVTSTSLMLNGGTSSVTITHGQSVNVQVQVTATSGTPAGDVALLVSSSGLPVDPFTLNSSGGLNSNSATTKLPGGSSYNVVAHYPGNANFLPSDSNKVPVTVNPEASLTTMRIETLDQDLNFQPFTSVPYGTFIYLRADVTDSNGDLSHGAPTGTVDFFDGGNDIVVGSPLNSQGNTATPNFLNTPLGGSPMGMFFLGVGSNSMTAHYSGDSSFNPSVSSPVNFTITQAATVTTVAASGAPQGANLTATVNTTSGGLYPTGQVTFFLNNAPVGAPVTNLQAVGATTNPTTGALVGALSVFNLSDPTLANGQYTLSATYSGDASYKGSASAPVVIKIQPDFALSAFPNVINIPSPGQPGGLNLTVTANDGFTGTVQFSCAGLPAESTCTFSPATIAASGTTTLTVTTMGPHGVASLNPDHVPIWMAGSVVLLGGILLIGLPRRRSCWACLALLMLAFLLAIVGCGGGNASPPPPPRTDPGTPSGTSNVIVTAASGSLSHSVSFTLIVP